MYKIKVTKPNLPEYIEIQAEQIEGDASLRISDGIELVICWPYLGSERGLKTFLCSKCINDVKQKWHDKRCMGYEKSSTTLEKIYNGG